MKISGFFISVLIFSSVYLMANYSTAEEPFAPDQMERSLASAKTKKEVFYKCTRGKELRWMRLYYQKNGKCKTVYSKGGDAKEVSSAVGYEACENVLNNIKKNLEAGAYVCEEKVLMGALEIE
ncbi:MAG: hypothetical protein H7Z71_05340 [Moraxellaceae bacterium]|nr:hypothetical protein [Pseudobdellovibrionaceae bacterium]